MIWLKIILCVWFCLVFSTMADYQLGDVFVCIFSDYHVHLATKPYLDLTSFRVRHIRHKRHLIPHNQALVCTYCTAQQNLADEFVAHNVSIQMYMNELGRGGSMSVWLMYFQWSCIQLLRLYAFQNRQLLVCHLPHVFICNIWLTFLLALKSTFGEWADQPITIV